MGYGQIRFLGNTATLNFCATPIPRLLIEETLSELLGLLRKPNCANRAGMEPLTATRLGPCNGSVDPLIVRAGVSGEAPLQIGYLLKRFNHPAMRTAWASGPAGTVGHAVDRGWHLPLEKTE